MTDYSEKFDVSFIFIFFRLTNEESRKNWEEHGNPDGPGGMFTKTKEFMNNSSFINLSKNKLSGNSWPTVSRQLANKVQTCS